MPPRFRAGIPPELEAIDRKAMALDPGDRFASAAAMADALERLAGRPLDRGRRWPVSPAPAVGAGSPPGRARAGAAVGLAAGAAAVRACRRARSPRVSPARTRRPARAYPPDAYAGAPSAVPPGPPVSRYDSYDDEPGTLGDQPVGLDCRPARPGDPRRGRLPDLQAPVRQLRPRSPRSSCPNFVGALLTDAQTTATNNHLTIVPTQFVKSNDQPDGTIVAQDPAGRNVRRSRARRSTSPSRPARPS